MNKSYRNVWKLVFITMCLLFLFSLLSLMPLFDSHPYVVYAIGELSIIIPIIIGISMLRKNSMSLNTSTFSKDLVPVLMVLPFCAQAFFSVVLLPIQALIYNFLGEMPNSVPVVNSFGEYIIQVLVICLLPAVLEELLFRSIIMRMLKPYGIATTILASALAFSMLHMDLRSFVMIFVMGMFLAIVKLATGSLSACILVHFSNNLFSITLSAINLEGLGAFQYLFTLVPAFIFPFLFMHFLKKCRKNIYTLTTQTKKTGFSVGLCLSVILYAVMGIAGAI